MLNISALQGRLVADPELKHTPSGTAVCSFRLAVERNIADSSGERKADFIDIVAWRQTAEFVCKYFTKGQMIALQGSIQTRSYEDKNGTKRTAVEVVAREVSFCGDKRESAPKPQKQAGVGHWNEGSSTQKGQAVPAPAAEGYENMTFDSDEDLPF